MKRTLGFIAAIISCAVRNPFVTEISSCAVRNPFLTEIVETTRVSTYGTDHKKSRPAAARAPFLL